MLLLWEFPVGPSEGPKEREMHLRNLTMVRDTAAGRFSVEEVLAAVRKTRRGKTGKGFFKFGGKKYRFTQRMRCFLLNGTTCAYCGLKGSYFIRERDRNSDIWHLALYAKNHTMKDVLMTHDHVLPISLGGSVKAIENSICCCYPCNQAKADNPLFGVKEYQ